MSGSTESGETSDVIRSSVLSATQALTRSAVSSAFANVTEKSSAPNASLSASQKAVWRG